MNPLLIEFLSSLARFGLAYAAGILTRHKVIDENEASKYVQAASSWLVVAALSAAPLIWAHVKHRMTQKTADKQIEVAIKGPADATVAEVKEIAKAKEGV